MWQEAFYFFQNISIASFLYEEQSINCQNINRANGQSFAFFVVVKCIYEIVICYKGLIDPSLRFEYPVWKLSITVEDNEL